MYTTHMDQQLIVLIVLLALLFINMQGQHVQGWGNPFHKPWWKVALHFMLPKNPITWGNHI